MFQYISIHFYVFIDTHTSCEVVLKPIFKSEIVSPYVTYTTSLNQVSIVTCQCHLVIEPAHWL